jgi:hypothetical protein
VTQERTVSEAFVIQEIEAALRRAALKARELGEGTQTPVFILREGRIVDLRTGVARASATSTKEQ